VRDDDIRSSYFASLDVLCAKHGPEVPLFVDRSGDARRDALEALRHP